MTPEQFYALPPAIALRILVEGSSKLQEIISDAEPPKIPRAPKYDQRVPRKGGFHWASELTLSDLEWWHQHKLVRSAEGGQYADKDAKLARSLSFWVEWRRVEPTATWTGERNNEVVTASPPAGEARVYEWPDRGPVTSPLPLDVDDDPLPF